MDCVQYYCQPAYEYFHQRHHELLDKPRSLPKKIRCPTRDLSIACPFLEEKDKYYCVEK
jgi:hypothetical protein